jgi:hypothetical protein
MNPNIIMGVLKLHTIVEEGIVGFVPREVESIKGGILEDSIASKFDKDGRISRFQMFS